MLYATLGAANPKLIAAEKSEISVYQKNRISAMEMQSLSSLAKTRHATSSVKGMKECWRAMLL